MASKVAMADGIPESHFGSVGRMDDGRSFVLFERQFAHSIERVWAAITEPDQLARWFPGFKLELRQGGRFEIWFTGESGECEGPSHVQGEVTEYDPPKLLQCGTIRFELASIGPHCKLTFSDVLQLDGIRTNAEFSNSVLGGWHRFLDVLDDALEGRTIDHGIAEYDYSKREVPGRD